MSEAVKKELWLTEEQCADIADVLLEKESRCRRNAQHCLSGYGTATSSAKHDRWIKKGEYYNQLAVMLNEPWL